MIIEFILLFINFQHYVGFKYFKKKNLESPPPHTTINEFAQNLGGNLHGKVYFFLLNNA